VQLLLPTFGDEEAPPQLLMLDVNRGHIKEEKILPK
jgi:hypothetical protein